MVAESLHPAELLAKLYTVPAGEQAPGITR